MNEFSRRTGIRIRAVYGGDGVTASELAGTLLAAGKDRPGTDVFWNAEFSQTIELMRRGALESYSSSQAAGIPARYVDSDRHWTGLGARCRVLLVHTRLAPSNLTGALETLLTLEIPSHRIGIAYPISGTAAVHAAALGAVWGLDPARWFFQRLRNRGVRVLDNGSAVLEQVTRWQLAVGLTDSNDACAAVARGIPVRVELPDQDSAGTLVIPGTVALLKGAPHPEDAKRLIDYLLSPETDGKLLDSGFSQISLRQPDVPRGCLQGRRLKAMDVTLEAICERLPATRAEMEQIFVR